MSPRATPTEEPDGGNLLVRIWRGAGVGNLPAYSTMPFGAPAGCVRPYLPRRPRRPRPRAPKPGGARSGQAAQDGRG